MKVKAFHKGVYHCSQGQICVQICKYKLQICLSASNATTLNAILFALKNVQLTSEHIT